MSTTKQILALMWILKYVFKKSSGLLFVICSAWVFSEHVHLDCKCCFIVSPSASIWALFHLKFSDILWLVCAPYLIRLCTNIAEQHQTLTFFVEEEIVGVGDYTLHTIDGLMMYMYLVNPRHNLIKVYCLFTKIVLYNLNHAIHARRI